MISTIFCVLVELYMDSMNLMSNHGAGGDLLVMQVSQEEKFWAVEGQDKALKL